MIPSPHKTQRAKFINIFKMSFFVRTGSFWKIGLFLRNFLPGISFKKSKRKRNLCLWVIWSALIFWLFQCAMKSSSTFECCFYSIWGTGPVNPIQSHSCRMDLGHCCSWLLDIYLHVKGQTWPLYMRDSARYNL